MDQISDAALIEASFTAPEQFGVLYDRHAAALARYLIRRVGPDHGEALLGDVFRIAFETRRRYQLDRNDALPWLYGIATNLLMRHNRRTVRGHLAIARAGAQPPDHEGFDDQVARRMAAGQTWAEVRAAIATLAPADREVLLLYAWEQLSYADIAIAVDVPVGTVRSRLNRARVRLRELIDDGGEVPDEPSLGAGGGTPR